MKHGPRCTASRRSWSSIAVQDLRSLQSICSVEQITRRSKTISIPRWHVVLNIAFLKGSHSTGNRGGTIPLTQV